VLPAGAGAEVGGDPTASASAATAVGVGRWSRGGTLFGTLENQYRMELP
jgi:hypothetical protein